VSRSMQNKAKAQKKENAIKKANRKKIIIIGICVLVAAAAVIVTLAVRNQSSGGAEIYRYGGQSILLYANGNFTANLAHHAVNGSYTKANENGQTLVYFYAGGNQVIGRIINNSLYLPDEWDDGHGHGSVFPRVN